MCKKLQALFALLIFFTFTGSAQNTFTVNNTPGAPADYHTLQGAIDSVPPGSTLLLQASGQSYLQGIIRKPLVIYGAGYFLGQNNAPNTQAKFTESMVANLAFLNGSQGSIASGLSFVNSTGDPAGLRTRLNFDSTSNITVSRCKIPNAGCNCAGHDIAAFFNLSSSITIQQCYLIVGDGSILAPYQSSGILFKNNIIVGQIDPIAYAQAPFNYTFEGNSFYGNISSPSFTNGSFINNVFIQNPVQTVGVASPMSFADHNVCNVDIFPAGGTNIINADPVNTYVLLSNPAISSNDGIIQLKPGSVAIGYGTGGIDCGAFGSSVAYVLSGIPAIPNFYFASVPQTGTSTGGLKVQLKIKANN